MYICTERESEREPYRAAAIYMCVCRERERDLIGAYRAALPVSLLALPVQKYKYCADKCSVYLLYWYKGTNTDAAAGDAGVACYAAGGDLFAADNKAVRALIEP